MLVLILAVFLSIAFIWRPWQGFTPGIRGIQYSVDLQGGSRIMLSLEASQITLEVNNQLLLEGIVDDFENNMLFIIRAVEPFNPATKRATLEIGRVVTLERIENIIGDRGEVIRIENRVSDETRDEVMRMLQMRVDPYGTLGTQFKPVGANFIQFEIAGLEPESARERLGRQGRVEAFIEETIVWRGEDIERVGLSWVRPAPGGGFEYNVPFRISQDAANQFASASTGKAGYPLVIYLDRPDDAIIIFSTQILDELPLDVTYDENARTFYYSVDTYGFYLFDPPAVRVPPDFMPPQVMQFLQEQKGTKSRVIILGDFEDYSENVIDNIAALYPIETIPREVDEPASEWIKRAYGLKSAPTIEPEIAGKPATDVKITGTREREADARAEGKDLEMVLSQRLPVRISFESESKIEPRLGRGFMNEAVRAGFVAIMGVGALIYLRYRRIEIIIAIMGTMISELIITLGIASALGWVIGLPEIGGLIAVIGTGVEHQIIITDEVLRGGLPQTRRMSLRGRISRAFSIIFAAAATTIAAMVSLASLGFGAMRGFALITMAGVIIAVILTRPAYARIISLVLTAERLGP
jgi:preprotein translocase subunit SecD